MCLPLWLPQINRRHSRFLEEKSRCMIPNNFKNNKIITIINFTLQNFYFWNILTLWKQL